MTITIRSDMLVNYVSHMGNDDLVCQAARVSTEGDSRDTESSYGLINYLMKHRHGSPFEHGVITFYVEAPIFVFREMMRHRIASYNETSARYRDLEPVFYVPSSHRDLIRTTSAARPEFERGSDELHISTRNHHLRAYSEAWNAYLAMRGEGVASEVARSVLPVGIFSSAFVTMNPRGLMNFLSLRVHDKEAAFVSYPQREIEMVAERMEMFFKELWPLTHKAFSTNRRVAP